MNISSVIILLPLNPAQGDYHDTLWQFDQCPHALWHYSFEKLQIIEDQIISLVCFISYPLSRWKSNHVQIQILQRFWQNCAVMLLWTNLDWIWKDWYHNNQILLFSCGALKKRTSTTIPKNQLLGTGSNLRSLSWAGTCIKFAR